MPYLYWVLSNTQGHSGQPWILPEVFSEEEVREAWRYDNGGRAIHCINSPLTDGRMPFVQRNLLRNIIECTDSAIASATPGANLRYGHDGDAGDVLVKALLNEREATLPATPVSGPYYRWTDLREHYLGRLAFFQKNY